MRPKKKFRIILEHLRITARGLQLKPYRGSMLTTNPPDTTGRAEVFLEYESLLSVDDGRAYRARACGGEACDGTNNWHGWIEFLQLGEGSLVRTARETTQPDRTCTVYWSTGLTQVYLEGALERALSRVRIRSGDRRQGGRHHFGRPTPPTPPTPPVREAPRIRPARCGVDVTGGGS